MASDDKKYRLAIIGCGEYFFDTEVHAEDIDREQDPWAQLFYQESWTQAVTATAL